MRLAKDPLMHSSAKLEILFDNLFSEKYNTRLVGGGHEPVYLPDPKKIPNKPIKEPEEKVLHEIVYKEDYFASALHEIAHWCIAGYRRRQKIDYGYWYVEKRSASQQVEFQQFEQKPQALEWILSAACQFPFRLSYDNLEESIDAENFGLMVQQKVIEYLEKGLPPRASDFAQCLAEYFGGVAYFDVSTYRLPG